MWKIVYLQTELKFKLEMMEQLMVHPGSSMESIYSIMDVLTFMLQII